jgi:predicted Zn-dependent protease
LAAFKDMTMSKRREKIESMLKDEPKDVFLRYALAMEMEKAGEVEPALQLHAQLVAEQPPHIASYFRSAQILAEAQEIDRARSFLREGIEAARAARDFHAAAEMGEMLSDLGQYGE